MKIILDESDLRYIEKIDSRLALGESFPMFIGNKERPYWIEIEVTDIAKANNFVMAMNDPVSRKELSEKCGIKISAICYEKDSIMCQKLKDRIMQALQEN